MAASEFASRAMLISRLPANGGEITPDQDLTVGLERDGLDSGIRLRCKTTIQGPRYARFIKPSNVVSRPPGNSAGNSAEKPPDHVSSCRPARAIEYTVLSAL